MKIQNFAAKSFSIRAEFMLPVIELQKTKSCWWVDDKREEIWLNAEPNSKQASCLKLFKESAFRNVFIIFPCSK